jgi:putative FmdB family regulatory protein
MPIYEYRCADCGNQFEKLIRRSEDAETLTCPSCGQAHLNQQLSTFAPQMGATKSAPMPSCGQAGRCPNAGMCGMN